MKNKVCAKCKEELPAEMFQKCNRNKSGLHSYCRDCNRETMWTSQMRTRGKWWMEDGFRTEEEHFNYALRRYAELFNMPQLLKYQTITGSIKRYYNDDLDTKYKYNK
jgi:NAD-dependent SIR2 family protein deacetylase